jgi:hypothetical protein
MCASNDVPAYDIPDPEWNPHPWRVLMCDRFDEDFQFWVHIPAAIGAADARNQARDLHPEGSPLREERAA